MLCDAETYTGGCTRFSLPMARKTPGSYNGCVENRSRVESYTRLSLARRLYGLFVPTRERLRDDSEGSRREPRRFTRESESNRRAFRTASAAAGKTPDRCVGQLRRHSVGFVRPPPLAAGREKNRRTAVCRRPDERRRLLCPPPAQGFVPAGCAVGKTFAEGSVMKANRALREGEPDYNLAEELISAISHGLGALFGHAEEADRFLQ